MKNFFALLLLLAPLFVLSQTTATAHGGRATGSTSNSSGHNNVYKKGESYIVIKLWHDDEPLTSEEQEAFSIAHKQLAGKGITAVSYKWKTSEDILYLFKKHNIKGEVSTANGLAIKTGDSQIMSSSKKIILIIENNNARSICAGDNCEGNFLQSYFQLPRSKEVK